VNNLTIPNIDDKTNRDYLRKATELGDAICIDEKQDQAPVEVEASPRNVHGFKWVMVISSNLSSTFFCSLDNTTVADVQPRIVIASNDVTGVNWLGVGFVQYSEWHLWSS
jgi:hypothetical protein